MTDENDASQIERLEDHVEYLSAIVETLSRTLRDLLPGHMAYAFADELRRIDRDYREQAIPPEVGGE